MLFLYRNKWIHIICVPLIAATLIVALNYIPLNIDIAGYKIGLGEVALAITMAYYISLNVIFAVNFKIN